MLMKGEMTDENVAIAHRRQKDAQNFNDLFAMQLFNTMKALSDDPQEKQFFESSMQEFEGIAVKYNIEFERLFGKMDPKLITAPMTQWMYSYKVFTSYIISKESFL